jgi:eukaryotic-like serine/threonine-protein kinase
MNTSMNTSTKCPTSGELLDLLDGDRSDPERAAVLSHLDDCTSCQHSLEALANGDTPLTSTMLEQAAYLAPEPSSAYWPALKDAELALTVDTPTMPRPASEISLAFLDPPADGSHLGNLNNFEVVGVVGRGGMGIVLHAIDTCLQRHVAIKVLDPELSKDELAGKRFCREARAAASISHENVVAVHQVEHDETKNLPFLVMELITGVSLEKKLQREKRLSLREIVSIGMQTAAGLAAAHDKGLIHRDIKPGNILLEKSGSRVKLTDFGLARLAEDVRLTRTGMVAGTPLYMSPEQAVGDEVDARSDLFSLGVVLYELASGEPPFLGKTEEQAVPLREKNPELPEWFVRIVDKLLAKKPEDRFQSARQVADTLEHFWALLKSSDGNIVCPKKRAEHWRAVVIGVAAGLVTLVVGAAAAYLLLPLLGR